MEPRSRQCPDCPGQMELRLLQGHPTYVCFVCDRELSPVVIEDGTHWWGRFHLPLIDVFINPPRAIRQLSEHPSFSAALHFYYAASCIARIPFYRLYGWREVFIPPIDELVLVLAFGVALHFSARGIKALLSGTRLGSFLGGCTILLFLGGSMNLLAGALPQQSWIGRIPQMVLFFYLIAGVHSHYRLGVVASIMALLVSILASIATYVLVLIVGAVMILTVPGMQEKIEAGIMNLSRSVPAESPMRVKNDVARLLNGIARSKAQRAARTGPTPTLKKMDLPWGYSGSFEDLSGRTVRLPDLKGKVVLVNFWTTWCGPCVAELPSLAALGNALKGNPKIVMLCVTWEPRESVERFLRHSRLRFPAYLADPKVVSEMQFEGVPITYVLSPQGRVVAREVGARNWNSAAVVAFLTELAK